MGESELPTELELPVYNFRNAVYLENGWIDCEIDHPKYGWSPFTCDPNDPGALFDTKELYDRMVASGTVAPYIPPTPEELYVMQTSLIRRQRDFLLMTRVDPIVSNNLRWADLTAEEQQELTDYRRALLDITDQEGFPFNVVWPIEPQ